MDHGAAVIYPPVLGELETLNLALTGRIRGFARYGDGDFAVMRGQRDVYQCWSPSLAEQLAACLADPTPKVLNCVPRPVNERDTLYAHRWQAFTEANAGLLPLLGKSTYGSSYISRMDSVPELHTTLYWAQVARLWFGHDVTLVRGSERSLTSEKLLASPSPPKSVAEVVTAVRDGWKDIDRTFEQTVATARSIVLVCAGLAARPLVHRLVGHGFLAYDLGHLGLYFDRGMPRPIAECR